MIGGDTSTPPIWRTVLTESDARPQWLADAHEALDAAVAAAYVGPRTFQTTMSSASCSRSTVAGEGVTLSPCRPASAAAGR